MAIRNSNEAIKLQEQSGEGILWFFFLHAQHICTLNFILNICLMAQSNLILQSSANDLKKMIKVTLT